MKMKIILRVWSVISILIFILGALWYALIKINSSSFTIYTAMLIIFWFLAWIFMPFPYHYMAWKKK